MFMWSIIPLLSVQHPEDLILTALSDLKYMVPIILAPHCHILFDVSVITHDYSFNSSPSTTKISPLYSIITLLSLIKLFSAASSSSTFLCTAHYGTTAFIKSKLTNQVLLVCVLPVCLCNVNTPYAVNLFPVQTLCKWELGHCYSWKPNKSGSY